MGWHAETGQLVAAVFRFGGIFLGLLDIDSGGTSGLVQPDFRALDARNLSPDGNWLAYPAGAHYIYGPSNRVDLLDLAGQSSLTLLQLEPDQRLGQPFWSGYLAHQGDVAFLAGPATQGLDANDVFRPVRLLAARTSRPGTYTLVAEAAEGERLAQPVFCRDGSLLYRASRNGVHYLQQRQPGQPARTLLRLTGAFWPLACP
jgi:hypothetical protein